MTHAKSGTRLLRADTIGRVRTPAARREEILREFEQSGLSGVRFAALTGIKYSTLASWVRRGRALPEAGVSSQPAQFVEAVVEKPGGEPGGLEVELPGGARLWIRSPEQVALAAQLIRSLGPC